MNTALEGETLREVAQDPANPRHLYAATLTEIHVSEDGGESWKWLPAGGIDFRDIWAMAAHPSRPNEIYVGTLPAAVYVSENGGRSFRELSAFRQLPEYHQVDVSTAATYCSHSLHHFGHARAGRNPRRHRRGRYSAQPR